ncbi:hypothetical protein [Sphingobacterium endophyticum]|uniref:hypothetical protein n=1 Tax=Sphingobacterium endophyticum TaxID=2546448 RepID=UPI0012E19E40|nr:hypothetical protein [Sphingobacterium endophyticum]
MPLISKQREVQIHLSSLYDNLQSSVEKMKKELKSHRTEYEDACHLHIKSGFQLEKLWLTADRNYQNKFREFETHCFLLEILTDYRDEEGNFNHLDEFKLTLESLLQQFIKQEAYETCAVIKKWNDHFLSKQQ